MAVVDAKFQERTSPRRIALPRGLVSTRLPSFSADAITAQVAWHGTACGGRARHPGAFGVAAEHGNMGPLDKRRPVMRTIRRALLLRPLLLAGFLLADQVALSWAAHRMS